MDPRECLITAAIEHLEQACWHAKATHAHCTNTGYLKDGIPGRPEWWPFLSIAERGMAEAAIRMGAWEIPA